MSTEEQRLAQYRKALKIIEQKTGIQSIVHLDGFDAQKLVKLTGSQLAAGRLMALFETAILQGAVQFSIGVEIQGNWNEGANEEIDVAE